MKRAFTLIELIIIIIIVGIIAVTASNSFKKDTLIPATNQVLDHIRYTQQLALNQDMFIPSPDFSTYSDADRKAKDSRLWFKKWWQFQIHEGDDDYTIYSDAPTNGGNNEYDMKADDGADRIAIDPMTRELLAGQSANVPENFLRIANLKKEYGVEISMSGCGNSKHILFDQLGRPHCSKSKNDGSNYPYGKIKKSGNPIIITLTLEDGSDSSTICVTPVTGYTYISENNGCL